MGGLILGGVASSIAVVLAASGVGATGWPAVLLGEPAIWTVPLAFLTMIVLSLATARAVPSDVTQQLLALHLPSGSGSRRRTTAGSSLTPDRQTLTPLEALEAEGW